MNEAGESTATTCTSILVSLNSSGVCLSTGAQRKMHMIIQLMITFFFVLWKVRKMNADFSPGLLIQYQWHHVMMSWEESGTQPYHRHMTCKKNFKSTFWGWGICKVDPNVCTNSCPTHHRIFCKFWELGIGMSYLWIHPLRARCEKSDHEGKNVFSSVHMYVIFVIISAKFCNHQKGCFCCSCLK